MEVVELVWSVVVEEHCTLIVCPLLPLSLYLFTTVTDDTTQKTCQVILGHDANYEPLGSKGTTAPDPSSHTRVMVCISLVLAMRE